MFSVLALCAVQWALLIFINNIALCYPLPGWGASRHFSAWLSSFLCRWEN